MKADTPSSTALLIAASIVHLRNDARDARLVSQQAAHWCAAFLGFAGPVARRLPGLVGRGWFRRLVSLLERITIPGMPVHFALRKRYVRNWVLRNLRGGYRQVVVLGAGFDTLCLELHARFPEVRFVEIDHPATQAVKLRALDARGARPANVRFVPADLAHAPLDCVLAGCGGYDPAARTLFVAEGLLMYLDAGRVAALLDYVARGANRIAFSFLELRRDGRPDFRLASRLVSGWLGLRRERFRWGVRRGDLGDFLGARGLRLARVTDDTSFARRATRAPAVGEYLCAAEAAPGQDAASERRRA
jgi:methyltransferase (TIGR00027 family)